MHRVTETKFHRAREHEQEFLARAGPGIEDGIVGQVDFGRRDFDAVEGSAQRVHGGALRRPRAPLAATHHRDPRARMLAHQ